MMPVRLIEGMLLPAADELVTWLHRKPCWLLVAFDRKGKIVQRHKQDPAPLAKLLTHFSRVWREAEKPRRSVETFQLLLIAGQFDRSDVDDRALDDALREIVENFL